MKDQLRELLIRKSELLASGRPKTDDEVIAVSETIIELKNSIDPEEYLWKEYDAAGSRREAAMKALKMTREQRLKDKEDQSLTFLKVIQTLNTKEAKKKLGEEAAHIAALTAQKKQELKNKGLLKGDF